MPLSYYVARHMYFFDKTLPNFSLYLVIENLFHFLCLNFDEKFYVLYCNEIIIGYTPKVLGISFVKFAIRLTTWP